MKLKKRLIGAGLTLAAAVLLTACGQSASDGKTYSSTFGADPTTFNYLLDYAGDNTAIVTTKEYEEALKKWQKEKIETNAKYQKELANHVK